MNINRLAGTVTSATCAMLGEVAISISAGSINLPKSSYVVPVGGFVIAVIIVCLSDRSGDLQSRHRTEHSSVSAGSSGELVHVLRGTQKKRNSTRLRIG